jgi:hypothetical protein
MMIATTIHMRAPNPSLFLHLPSTSMMVVIVTIRLIMAASIKPSACVYGALAVYYHDRNVHRVRASRP